MHFRCRIGTLLGIHTWRHLTQTIPQRNTTGATASANRIHGESDADKTLSGSSSTGRQRPTAITFRAGAATSSMAPICSPKQFHGNIFYCEPSLNIVHRCVVSRDGAGYIGVRAQGEQQSEFLASTDQWFRPMNLRVGPEGALYIVDMYRESLKITRRSLASCSSNMVLTKEAISDAFGV